MERTERGRMRLSLEGERVPTDGEFAGAPGGRRGEKQARFRDPGEGAREGRVPD